jgi:hypothetical protein
MSERVFRSSFLRVLPLGLLCALFLADLPAVRAQDEERPPVKKPGVRITFLPPPLEGTLSLGIYDKAGKLVRTLHRESAEKDFVVGLNGFITHWDGKDQAGRPVPSGKYAARGYAVGRFEVEGIAFYANDWLSDESLPPVEKVESLAWNSEGFLSVRVRQPGGAPAELRVDREGRVTRAADGGTTPTPSGPSPEVLGALPGIESLQASCLGHHNGVWVVDKTSVGFEVKEYATSGELRRRMSIPSDQPPPVQIAAAIDSDLLFLLEENASLQRVRGLSLEPAPERAASPEGQAPPEGQSAPAAGAAPATEGSASSVWKTFLSKSRTVADRFETVKDQLSREKPFKPEEKFRVRLLPNPLFKDATQDVDLRLQIDERGSYLATADGLPLQRVTETPFLKWAVAGREGGKAVTFFESNGAGVAEFRAHRLANMMAFDAGDYEWPPAKNP